MATVPCIGSTDSRQACKGTPRRSGGGGACGGGRSSFSAAGGFSARENQRCIQYSSSRRDLAGGARARASWFRSRTRVFSAVVCVHATGRETYHPPTWSKDEALVLDDDGGEHSRCTDGLLRRPLSWVPASSPVEQVHRFWARFPDRKGGLAPAGEDGTPRARCGEGSVSRHSR